MKTRIIIFAILSVLMLSACSGSKDKKPVTVVGQWELMDIMETKSVQIGSEKVEIYIDFKADKTFELYQQIGEGAHRLYRGTWNLEGTLLTGKYNDGEDWASAYHVEMDNGQLILTSNNDAAEKSTYKKSEIPAEVKETCEVVVKSSLRMLNSQPQYRWL